MRETCLVINRALNKRLTGEFSHSWNKYSIGKVRLYWEKIRIREDWYLHKFRIVHLQYFTHRFPNTGLPSETSTCSILKSKAQSLSAKTK